MAVVGTGLAVAGGLGVLGSEGDPVQATVAAAATDELTAAVDATPAPVAQEAVKTSREALVTRSDRRDAADPAKADLLDVGAATTDNALTRTEDLSDEDPRTIARALLAEFGFSESQFGCLDSLWERESHWNPSAMNSSSGAYGIPQSLPGSKMASVAADWRTNPVTQIRWGLGYIQDRYGSPCGAWGHSQGHGWY